MPKDISAVVEKINVSAPSSDARWAFEGDVPFGDLEAGVPLSAMPVVHRLRLGNGLRLLLLVDRAAPVVAYYTWFRVGSRHEKPGKTGLAHLFEHLMFNETEGLKAGDFDHKLEAHGAESNAATWVDWTYYHESLPKDGLGLAVKLESERMARLVLREPQVTSEKEVVANERRMRVEDDIEGAANEALYATAFTEHPHHWPTIGWMKDIEGFTPEDCEAFYRTYYAPNNATLIVVGDVREAQVLQKIRDAYGAMPAARIPEEDTRPEPVQRAPREVELARPTATTKLLMGYHGPALGDADHAAATVLSEILLGGRASRLYEELITQKELCTEVRGWVSTFRDPGLWEMYATVREGRSAAEVLDVFEAATARVRDGLVSDDELARAKARLELGALQGMDTASGMAEQIGFYDSLLGDPAGAFRKLEAMRRVTAGELRTVARRYLRPEARTLVRVVPEERPHGATTTEGAAEASA
ncbi:MAG: insulinase family protein [Myxococcales bacterium]|nr:insulinase family protein [Myxococcales bacterium]